MLQYFSCCHAYFLSCVDTYVYLARLSTAKTPPVKPRSGVLLLLLLLTRLVEQVGIILQQHSSTAIYCADVCTTRRTITTQQSFRTTRTSLNQNARMVPRERCAQHRKALQRHAHSHSQSFDNPTNPRRTRRADPKQIREDTRSTKSMSINVGSRTLSLHTPFSPNVSTWWYYCFDEM